MSASLMRPGAAIALLLLLASCASQPPAEDAPAEPRKTLVYGCDQDEIVISADTESATLYLGERAYQLTREISASGAKYVAGDVEYWSKGGSALIKIGSRRYSNCILDPSRAPWEEARRRGVQFRGVGQEPGWLVEITPGGQILLVTGYGQQRWIFTTPEPEQSDDLTIYQVNEAGQQLTVTLTADYCQDTMSGEVFDNVVTVELDDMYLQGCGSALQPDWHWD